MTSNTSPKIDKSSFRFTKMAGHGNDFIIFDNRDGRYSFIKKKTNIQKICKRGSGVGADGLIFLEEKDNPEAEYHFKWDFYNPDGSHPGMCANGSRCVVRYALDHGLVTNGHSAAKNNTEDNSVKFLTKSGIISGSMTKDKAVEIELTEHHSLTESKFLEIGSAVYNYFTVDTGAKHIVIPVDNLQNINVAKLGRKIKNYPAFEKHQYQYNVNFVEVLSDKKIKLRTYENGVEDETQACGTGVVATVIVLNSIDLLQKEVEAIVNYHQPLFVNISKDKPRLMGKVEYIYEAELKMEF